MDKFQLIATTTAGLEAPLKRELGDLGIDDAKVFSPGRIIFSGDAQTLVRANLWLRTADRILLVMDSFKADDFDELFERSRDLPWGKWIAPDSKFPVRGRSYKSKLSSVPACQRTVKKAIVEKLYSDHLVAKLPETGASCNIEIAIREDIALLTIDTSGAGLNKRGYRAAAGPAPLKETLAAAMIQLSFWKPDRQLIDPFCGGGTIPIEAAMIARNIAPGLSRSFAAEQWLAIESAVWESERNLAREQIKPNLDLRIIATDIEPKALSLSRHHADLAGVVDDIHFQQQAFCDLTTSREYGCIITNPPYGKRFNDGDAAIHALYRSMPDVFRRLKTWSIFLITSMNLEDILGQQATKRRKLYNGKIECTYYQYHGPKREKRNSKYKPAPQIIPQDELQDEPQADPQQKPAAKPAFGGLQAHASKQIELFTNRLRKMARHFRRWPKRGISCYRIYDRDIPEIPLVIDIYEDCLHIAEYDRPSDRTPAEHGDWLDKLSQVAGDVLGIDSKSIFLKRRQKQRGSDQYNKIASVKRRGLMQVHEDGLAFEVNLSDYLDTGLFLDHRATRKMVRDESAGKRMLNLFAYTGSFSVYSAAGGAKSTTTVDTSNPYLQWAKRNLTANGFTGSEHSFVREDVMNFLRNHKSGNHYDLVVIDPPTFSNSKARENIFDVQRDYKELLEMMAGLMSDGGVIYFSTNFRRFKFDESLFLPSFDIREISSQTIGEDFRNKRIHRAWRIVVTRPPNQ